MYIRKSRRTYKGKTYTNYLLVESVQTPKGPRQRTICSLGSLEPGPVEDWLGLAHKLESALQGQESLPKASAEVEPWVEKARRRRDSRARSDEDRSGSTITVAIDSVDVEQAREAGPVLSKNSILLRSLRCRKALRPGRDTYRASLAGCRIGKMKSGSDWALQLTPSVWPDLPIHRLTKSRRTC